MLTSEITKCSSTECSCHHEALNDYAQYLVSTLLERAFPLIQTHLIKSLLAGMMGLVNSRRLLISGTRCRKRQGVLHQESCLTLKEVLRVDNMQFAA